MLDTCELATLYRTTPMRDSTPFVAFIPCRAGSVRVPNKNTTPFGQNRDGLIGRKLGQLQASKRLNKIVVSTDDPIVDETAKAYATNSPIAIEVVERPKELALAGVLDPLILHAAALVGTGVLCWMHVTSPFFDAEWVDIACDEYSKEVQNGPHDSLMGVSRKHDFYWRNGKCISHDRSVVKWPQTQDIEPFFEVNSTIFMAPTDLIHKTADRIGPKPYLWEVPKRQAMDIDWPDDFALAEVIALQEAGATLAP